MSKIRIYELAKELGVENKAVIEKAEELGMTGKASHSNSLSDSEAEQLRRAFIRAAVGNERTISTSVDQETGLTSKVVERRKGNVIRRRKTTGVEEPEEEPIVEEEAATSEPVEEVVQEEVEEVVEEELTEEKEEKGGPKILGKIKLALKPDTAKKKAKPEVSSEDKKSKKILSFSTVRLDVEEEESEDKKAKKKKTRFREYSRGDLVDYESKPRKKTGRKDEDDSLKTEQKQSVEKAAPKAAAKKVIKMTDDTISVGDLSNQMSLKAGQVITKLIELGVMATINQRIDLDTATIVADEFDFTIEYAGFDEEDLIKIEGIDDEAKQKPRPPVVTVMGHVDHGKTSLLDYIRKSTVASKEHGGITQHIGAYVVDMPGKKKISFIDTPGHAAFTAMRARGAEITDIVILVVAADDGVMPQTIEAISHAKAANVPIIVAINKMDKADAQPDRIKTQLAEHELQPEDWGGDVICAPVSALNGDGVDSLLESVLLVAELNELKANPDCRVQGTVIEVRTEQGRGTVATVLVQAGTLKIGDVYLAGANYGRVRSMMDHNAKAIKEAGPSIPVEITGFNGTPEAGDDFIVMESEARAKEVASHRMEKLKQKQLLDLAGGPVSLEEFTKQAGQEAVRELNIILKADVHGSLEAVKQSIAELSTDEVTVKIIHSAVGGVSESDVQLASASKAIIVGFNVRGEPRAMQMAESSNIEMRFYRVIYELVDEIKLAMAGLLDPDKEEVNLARVEVRDTFSVPKIGTVAGCYVLNGTVERGASVRLLRDSAIVYEGKMNTLRRFKDDVKEVQSGYECGMAIEGFNDIKVGDVIEVYKIKEIARTLD